MSNTPYYAGVSLAEASADTSQPVAQRQGQKAGKPNRRFALPALRIDEALDSWFVIDGESYCVGDRENDYALIKFCRACVDAASRTGATRKAQARRELRSLGYDLDELARWYAIDILLELGIHVPLYATRSECMYALQKAS